MIRRVSISGVKSETNVPKDIIVSKLMYDRCSGNLTWLQGTKYAGKVAGQITTRKTNSYVWVGVGYNGATYKIFGHRIIWMLMTGEWPISDIDHIDGDGLNNKWENLRCVDRSTNNKNHMLQRNNKSGIVGVNWLEKLYKWRAYSSKDSKQVHLGVYHDYFDACCARKSFEWSNGFTERHGRKEDHKI